MSRTAFRTSALLTTLALLAIPAAARAGGLIQSLPEDGAWVTFKVSSELDLQGNLQSLDHELKVASVGKQDVEGDPGRWIELSTELGGRKMLAKLLIAEKFLKAEQNPFEHVAKAWGRGPEGEVRELPEGNLRRLLLFAVAVPNFEKPEKKEKETIQTELGKYECEHWKGEAEVEGFQNNQVKFEGDLWTHNKVPFGLVKAKIKGDFGLGSLASVLEATKSGTGAKSDLPDAN